jgi:hypothetical protein
VQVLNQVKTWDQCVMCSTNVGRELKSKGLNHELGREPKCAQDVAKRG